MTTVDDRAWMAAVDAWMVLADKAGHDGSVGGAQAIQHRTIDKLVSLSHPPHTRTLSAPGQPPAMISGALAASIMVGVDGGMVAVGPTTSASSYNGAYGRIQELGGPSSGNPYMKWTENGRRHYVHYRELPERPYLKPATEEVIDSGELLQIYWMHWALAQAEVTA